MSKVDKTLRKLAEAVQKGNITPELLSVAGDLDPEIAARFFDKVKDVSAFLQRITLQYPMKQISTFRGLDVPKRALGRVPEGEDPSSFTGPTRADVTFTNLPVNLFYRLLFSTLQEHRSDPDLEAKIEAMFAKAFANDLTRLGFEGTSDDYAGETFVELNVGWPALAKAGAPAGQKPDINGVADIDARLDLLLAAMPSEIKDPGRTTFIMSTGDYEKFAKAQGDSAASVLAQILLTGNLPTYLGYPILPVQHMADDEYLFCDPANIWMTMQQNSMYRARKVEETKRCIDYTFQVHSDYGFQWIDEVVCGWDQGG